MRLGGLIDAHVHLAAPDVKIGVPAADHHRLGVVGVVEAGSYGAEQFEAAAAAWRRQIAVRVFASVVPRGLRDPRHAWGPPSDDPLALFARTGIKPDGVKLRLGQSPGRDDLADARNALAAASAFGLRLMVHVTGATCDADALLDALRPGDVLTHCFCTPPFSVLDDTGRVRDSARRARERGVIFDLARGATGHFDPEVARRALAQGFAPDFLSTDWANQPQGHRGPNLIATMRELLHLGMAQEAILAAVTEAPARFYGFTIPPATNDSFVELTDDFTFVRVVREGKDLGEFDHSDRSSM